jgi:hypothetical protein
MKLADVFPSFASTVDMIPMCSREMTGSASFGKVEKWRIGLALFCVL